MLKGYFSFHIYTSCLPVNRPASIWKEGGRGGSYKRINKYAFGGSGFCRYFNCTCLIKKELSRIIHSIKIVLNVVIYELRFQDTKIIINLAICVCVSNFNTYFQIRNTDSFVKMF